jgi:hypothetical protein
MPDTERGLTELLEARRDRIVTHTNVEPVGIDEFRAFIDLALAALDAGPFPIVSGDDYVLAYCQHCGEHSGSFSHAEFDHADDCPGVRMANSLDTLLDHLAGEGV